MTYIYPTGEYHEGLRYADVMAWSTKLPCRFSLNLCLLLSDFGQLPFT